MIGTQSSNWLILTHINNRINVGARSVCRLATQSPGVNLRILKFKLFPAAIACELAQACYIGILKIQMESGTRW